MATYIVWNLVLEARLRASHIYTRLTKYEKGRFRIDPKVEL